MSKHVIEWHPSDRLIVVKPIGFWTQNDFEAYRTEMLAAIDRAGAPFDIMTDMSERVPQSSHVAALLDKLAAQIAGMGLRRFVVVGASTLLGMQARRVTKIASPHFVSSIAEGHMWLQNGS